MWGVACLKFGKYKHILTNSKEYFIHKPSIGMAQGPALWEHVGYIYLCMPSMSPSRHIYIFIEWKNKSSDLYPQIGHP